MEPEPQALAKASPGEEDCGECPEKGFKISWAASILTGRNWETLEMNPETHIKSLY
ncbi:hypothetical protein [Desulfonatronovibrio magnus]|uniref:hypothetical protein n=1 Tax=Desulfonatronovibrio magnus TaxID=698827 RepID=UPI0012FA8071|nr:hypothetical protein [Desulfonatronovibrio magnus]